VTPPAANVPVGATAQLTATGLYSDGSTSDLTNTVSWSSSSPGNATVSASGVVSGLVTGAAVITATDPSSLISGTAAIAVIQAALTSLSVSPSPATVPRYDILQLTATGHYSDGATGNVTDSVTWSSSDTSIATVSATGLVTGGANTGTVTITATDPSTGVTGTTILTVTGPAITVTPTGGSHSSAVTVTGQGFVPGTTVKIKYVTGIAGMVHPNVKICVVVIGEYGLFTCNTQIPNKNDAGTPGPHTVFAKTPHTHGKLATTTYTLTS
jgi:uncharacterized protein YjdB